MITTLTGPNGFLLRAELERIINAFVKEHGDTALERLDGEDIEFDRIRESLESMPFLASKKMVVLRLPGANKAFVESAEKLLANVPETINVVLVEPKLDKRLSYYKFLQKNTEMKEFSDLDEYSLAKWLVNHAKAEDGTLAQQDAIYLIERVGTNQRTLANELAKLLSYDKSVTRQTINLLTDATPQSTIFELLDAAFAGNTRRALALFSEQRALKVEPQQIVAMLAWQLHILAIIKTAGHRNLDEISREAKLNPYVLRKSQAIASKSTLQELKTLIARTLELDVRLKSESINPDDAIQHLLLTINK